MLESSCDTGFYTACTCGLYQHFGPDRVISGSVIMRIPGTDEHLWKSEDELFFNISFASIMKY